VGSHSEPLTALLKIHLFRTGCKKCGWIL